METYQYSPEELKEALQEGLMALSVEAGQQVLVQMLAEDAERLAGPKGKHNPERSAVRHGTEQGSVTLGGRRMAVEKPRVRSLDGHEHRLPTYEHLTLRDALSKLAVDRMLAGLSTRLYERSLEPISARQAHRARGITRSCISRRFIQLTRIALEELMSADLADLKPVVLMIDGAVFAKQQCVVALVIDIYGRKHPVGIIQGATENKVVVTDLLADLVARNLDYSHGLLVVLDGAKALAAAAKSTFGEHIAIQRCIEHKIRNVKGYLHKDEQSWVELKLRLAWKRTDPDAALRDLKGIATRLEETNIDAAKSLREGMHETLTIQRLGVGPILARTLRSTNVIESMWEIVRAKHRNVKCWKAGDMRLRWAAAGMLEAQSQFRRVEGYSALPSLARTLHHTLVLKDKAA
jgi:putative transposase